MRRRNRSLTQSHPPMPTQVKRTRCYNPLPVQVAFHPRFPEGFQVHKLSPKSSFHILTMTGMPPPPFGMPGGPLPPGGRGVPLPPFPTNGVPPPNLPNGMPFLPPGGLPPNFQVPPPGVPGGFPPPGQPGGPSPSPGPQLGQGPPPGFGGPPGTGGDRR